MHAAPFHLQDHMFHLDPAGALFWPAERVAVVADLHLEKASAAARQGQLLPPWDTRATLDRLALLLRRLKPRTVIALGDSFHDPRAAARLAPEDASRLRDMTRTVDFIWIHGNHDPLAPEGLGGRNAASWSAGGITFRHQANRGDAGEVSGHFHPKARVPTRAGEVVRPCFVADARKIMLPAFGAYTGGLNVRAPAIAAHFPKGGRVFLLGRDRLFSFPLRECPAVD
jgi:DNA ligase-associated metallophosphoesterase